ncbi:hypothetical protein LIA77_07167 [Sarocladium implicatum]|nr:hypothetical protein LIA77_07167 [Sarocladium implicatum]
MAWLSAVVHCSEAHPLSSIHASHPPPTASHYSTNSPSSLRSTLSLLPCSPGHPIFASPVLDPCPVPCMPYWYDLNRALCQALLFLFVNWLSLQFTSHPLGPVPTV